MPLSRTNLGSKSEKDLAGLKRSKSAVKLQEDEETVVVDVTRLHRKEVRVWQLACLTSIASLTCKQWHWSPKSTTGHFVPSAHPCVVCAAAVLPAVLGWAGLWTILPIASSATSDQAKLFFLAHTPSV